MNGTILDGIGIFELHRDHGIIANPEESRGIFSTGKIPRKDLEFSIYFHLRPRKLESTPPTGGGFQLLHGNLNFHTCRLLPQKVRSKIQRMEAFNYCMGTSIYLFIRTSKKKVRRCGGSKRPQNQKRQQHRHRRHRIPTRSEFSNFRCAQQ